MNSIPGASEARTNSVKQLCELYNVLIGIALSLSIYHVVDITNPENFKGWPTVLNFIAFCLLIIPFYHGAVRHLYSTYVEGGPKSDIKSFALFFDYVILFAEGGIFVFMALMTGKVEFYTDGVIALLVIDIIWGLLANLAFSGSDSERPEINWAMINGVTVFFIVLICHIWLSGIYSWGIRVAAALTAIIILRTAADYTRAWKFYFPPYQ
jgi:uncharacterized membrane protein